MDNNNNNQSSDLPDDLVAIESVVKYDSQCIRKRTNWGNPSKKYDFGSDFFEPEVLLNDIPNNSPKLDALFKKIKELDANDMKSEGKLYKHFIFSDLKSSAYGAKLIASAMIAHGFNLGYFAQRKIPKQVVEVPTKELSPVASPSPASPSPASSLENTIPESLINVPSAPPSQIEGGAGLGGAGDNDDDEPVEYVNGKKVKKVKIWGKLELLDDAKLKETPNQNFYLLSSVGVFDNPINVTTKKTILKKFNQRPENVQGEEVRFIVMDSGFKEGIDLFDIKYIHIYEPQQTAADQKQVIGRGTRTCGQKGLTFHPTQGWPLYVFIYDLSIPKELRQSFLQSKRTFDFYLKSMNIDLRLYNFMDDLEKTTIFGSVDYELNKNIHNFAIEYDQDSPRSDSSKSSSPDSSPSLEPSNSSPASVSSSIWSSIGMDGGAGKKKIIVNNRSPIVVDSRTNVAAVPIDQDFYIQPFDLDQSLDKSSFVKPIKPSRKSSLSRKKIPKPRKTATRKVSQVTSPLYPNIFQINIPQSSNRLNFQELRDHIKQYYSEFEWTDVKMENLCEEKKAFVEEPEEVQDQAQDQAQAQAQEEEPVQEPEQELELEQQSTTLGSTMLGGASTNINYTPTQDFIKHYINPMNPCKGTLLWHSVGTGKTCSAIAAATASFERQGYTILWVTRTTLKNDIWKNMFDQVCNEHIRHLISTGTVIPDDQKSRMKLLSKSWKIRPMSYKQFSNLVSKQNNLYHNLVKINGQADPLRKTLLIIDEAHKLYGGNDLSSLERPDMNALRDALINSYNISGNDSVRLILMTATPITQNPMEIIKLINLCKPFAEQMPDEFDAFSNEYLLEDGSFSVDGKRRYLDDIAGYVSYLNREKDARQFSQPRIKFVRPSIISNPSDIQNFDRKFMREYYESDIIKLKQQIAESNKDLDSDLKDITASKYGFLAKSCDRIEDPSAKKVCMKIVRKNIRELVIEVKEHVKTIQKGITDIKDDIKNKNLFKQDALQSIRDNLERNPVEFEKFKRSAYYNIKYKCGKKTDLDTDFVEALQTHPQMMKLNGDLSAIDLEIRAKMDSLKLEKAQYASKIKQLSDMLKTKISSEEKSAIRITIADSRKTAKIMMAAKRKKILSQIGELKSQKSGFEKDKTKHVKGTKKQLKTKLRENAKEERSQLRDIARAEKALQKTLQSQGEYAEIQNDTIKDLVSKYTVQIHDEFLGMQSELQDKLDVKMQKEQQKQTDKLLKQTAQQQKKTDMAARKTQKATNKIFAQQQKQADLQQKAADKQAKLAAAKAAKVGVAKTQKIGKPRFPL